MTKEQTHVVEVAVRKLLTPYNTAPLRDEEKLLKRASGLKDWPDAGIATVLPALFADAIVRRRFFPKP